MGKTGFLIWGETGRLDLGGFLIWGKQASIWGKQAVEFVETVFLIWEKCFLIWEKHAVEFGRTGCLISGKQKIKILGAYAMKRVAAGAHLSTP